MNQINIPKNTTHLGQNAVKASTVIDGYFALFIAIILNLTIFIATFLPSVNISWIFFIFFSIMVLLGLAGSIYYFKQTTKFKKEKLNSKYTSVASQIGTAFKFTNLIKTIISLLFVVIFIVFFIYALSKYGLLQNFDLSELSATTKTYVYLGFFLIFLILCIFFRKQSYGGIKKVSRIPFFNIEKDGIIIDINYLVLFNKKKRYFFKVFFNEIDELKELSFIEAQYYQKHTIGPDIPLVMKKVKQEFDFLNGKISRPDVYITEPSSVGKILVIRGPKIFYMIAFSNESIAELFDAYNQFKKNSGKNNKTKKTAIYPPIPSKLPPPPRFLNPNKKVLKD